jgi:hypothetical protein
MDIGVDMVSSIQSRLSMQSRRSHDPHRRMSVSSQHGDREALIRAYDAEEAQGFALEDLAESDDEGRRPNGSANGGARYGEAIELQERKGDT